ncbi:Hsp20/alpha crystallin family protein [Streptomyces prasinus]
MDLAERDVEETGTTGPGPRPSAGRCDPGANRPRRPCEPGACRGTRPRGPPNVDTGHITAELAGGVLTVRVPKARKTEPHRIEITG